MLYLHEVLNDNESWRIIADFEDYIITDTGKIISMKRNKFRILKQNTASNKYLQVCLCKNGKRSTKNVHDLVATNFIGEKNEKYIDHINKNKLDNRLENLRLVSPSENASHRTIKGTIYKRKAKAGNKFEVKYYPLPYNRKSRTFDSLFKAELYLSYKSFKRNLLDIVNTPNPIRKINKTNFSCESCRKYFKTENSLKSHKKTQYHLKQINHDTKYIYFNKNYKKYIVQIHHQQISKIFNSLEKAREFRDSIWEFC